MQRLQSLVDDPTVRRRVGDAALLAAGPVATRHINFRGVLNFPVASMGEPILRPPVRWRA